ncbi:lytic transglycosylase domain-containing protein [Rahnella sp. ChDrAdgB13]|uniref:lytic transglycosylase domain-containing protein n=1 Tax=Rahnella sp. ChDrAdgB13 TaxID=1850581 RepID=UPI001AD896B5
MRRLLLMMFCLFLAMISGRVQAARVSPEMVHCFHEAGMKFSVDWRLLWAIAEVESGFNPVAIGLNIRNGKVLSEDIGVMQINSSWLPTLRGMGITREVLLSNSCQNIHVGAWILANNIRQNGVNWTSVGAYNAGFKEANEAFRMKYARKVYDRYIVLTGN